VSLVHGSIREHRPERVGAPVETPDANGTASVRAGSLPVLGPMDRVE
jgi:hypothetical protein